MTVFNLWGRYIGASTGWKKAAKVNCALLTLMISLQLASSNFFMQVLNAPSRDELDVAHRRVFSTEYRESDFTVIIATEEFLNGGSYYLPGASLLTADGYKSGDGLTSERSATPLLDGFGHLFSMSEYTTNGSDVEKNISDAALHGKELKRLEFSDCQREFGLYGAPCSGLTRYRDVILVAQSSAGWKRNEMWHLLDNQTRFWDYYVPPDKPNQLFYYTTCTMNGEFGGFGSGGCKSSCYSALGGRDSDSTSEWPSGYSFFSEAALAYVNGTSDNNFGASKNRPTDFNYLIGYLNGGIYDSNYHPDPSLPNDAIATLGYSPVSLFIVAVLATILITIPLLFSLKRISPHIVPGATNSLLLAMACRVSPLLLDQRSTAPAPDAGSEQSFFLPHPFPNRDTEGNEDTDSLLQLTKLRFPLESYDGEEYDSTGNGELYDVLQAEESHSSEVRGGELEGNTTHSHLANDANDKPENLADELRRIARNEIRWGVLKMPPEWYNEHDYEPLGFATRGEDVTTPVEGKWYL
ncbi:hypothetical protein FHL15_005322 [Xylaria flabelliformis]|uniref:DUF6536 domain-containing protein n=1 Tax=Xylaria flabelliformis TaxID=2512241 RepID=A0A553I0B3_9PEZI|nr:hypothetical protein FHL15_005322 [Xylaria flabelliformis]